MSIPRIQADQAGLLQRFIALPGGRFIFAAAAVGVMLIVLKSVGAVHHVAEFPVLLLSIAIAASSVFGGLAPGLFSTLLACLAGAFLIGARPGAAGRGLGADDLTLLASYGVVMSLVGWLLWRSKARADRVDADNRDLERQILEIGDAERQRIGHDLHDGLGQHLTGISLLASSLNQQAAAGHAVQVADVDNVTRLVSEAVSWTRDLARSLSPLTLEHEGLLAALEELASNTAVLFRIQCEFDYTGVPITLDAARSLHLYRIAQEAISNSVKHGKAKRVRISVTVTGNNLLLQIDDDGSGLSQKTISQPGLGLRIMQYRARMVGAELSARRASVARGTSVKCVCRIP